MAAKTKHSSTRKGPTKSLEVEVVPDLRPQVVVKQLSSLEALIGKAEEMSDAKVIAQIKNCTARASRHARTAVRSGALSLIYAWACGRLLNAAKDRTQAYIACGILPESPGRESGDPAEIDEVKTQALLSSITGIQKRLRLFLDSSSKLGADDKNQLKLAKRQINELFNKLLA